MSLLRLFVTGGTFDKEYDEINGQLFFKDSHVAEMLRLGRSLVDIDIRTLMMIDSLEMKTTDRELILRSCKEAEQDRIVITHGTDTMEKTAQFLGASFESGEIHTKTIVLTGAMIPYKFGSSDGLFNLGSAIAFAQILEPGIYLAMNGRALNWKTAKKDRRTGEFHEN